MVRIQQTFLFFLAFFFGNLTFSSINIGYDRHKHKPDMFHPHDGIQKKNLNFWSPARREINEEKKEGNM